MAIDLIIRIKKHPDGSASLSCTRADGSVTWQKQHGKRGAVFPPHDLTHFAVEHTLEYRHGFYGLLADGWDIADFAKPWPRGPIPAEAMEVELRVGFFDMERLQQLELTAEEFLHHAETFIANRRASGKVTPSLQRVLSTRDFMAVRTMRTELLAQWASVPHGDTLELHFNSAG